MLRPAKSRLIGLHGELRDANDEKLHRIVAMLGETSDPTFNRALFDPIRFRLAALKPARPLRFARLLFIPMNKLIVRPSEWKPDEPAIPRTALTSIARMVRREMGGRADRIEEIIAGHTTAAQTVIAKAGGALWASAGEILAAAPAPRDWPETGLRPAHYQGLATAMACVLRRAALLNMLYRYGDQYSAKATEAIVGDVLFGIGGEPRSGCAMVFRLLLVQSPHAAEFMRRFITALVDRAQQRALQSGMALATETVLADMEDGRGLRDAIGSGPLGQVAPEVRRIATMLREIGRDLSAGRNPRRLEKIKDALDQACRSRFAEALNDGVVTPLAEGSVGSEGHSQSALEVRIRELRVLESEARLVGGGASYDRLIGQAVEIVLATGPDTLSPVGKCRLIELLAGPEAAVELYWKQMGAAQGDATAGGDIIRAPAPSSAVSAQPVPAPPR